MKHPSTFFSRLSVRGIGTLTLRLSFLVLLACCASATAQTTAFTYQGKLADASGNPLAGNFDFQFKLFDASSNGNQVGAPLTFDGTGANLPFVVVTNGIFAVTLDFVNCSGCNCPLCFNGAARFLEIAVKPHGGGTFPPPLTDRQPITSTPYAVKSVTAATATTADGLSLACVNCVTSSQIASVNGSAVAGTIPVDSMPAGSANYIQNTTSPQSASNFNISGGNGTANIFNAATQFNIGGNRILSNAGNDNLFAGQRAGELNTGSFNAFFGRGAGRFNTSGSSNSFFGFDAGFNNDDGGNNTFIGTSAGFNSFGSLANGNTFVGVSSGGGNTTGRGNTMIGFSADVPVGGGVINASAIGSRAFVTQSNSLVLGSINGVNNALADTNVGIGTTAPSQRLHVVGNGLFTGDLTVNGTLNATLPTGNGNYIQNTTSQQSASNFNISGDGIIGGHLGVGTPASAFKLEIVDPLNAGLRVQTNATGGTLASFGGNGAFQIDANGVAGGRLAVLENGKIGIGTASPLEKLHLSGIDVTRVRVNSDSNAGFSLALNEQAKWSLATVTGGNLLIFNEASMQNAVSINATSNDVGIGTSAPKYKLHVTGSSGFAGLGGLGVESDDLFLASFKGDGVFSIGNQSAPGGRFTLLGDRVGIGVTNPNAKLHIADNGGNILFGQGGCSSGFTGIGFGSLLFGCINYALGGNGTDTVINRPGGGAIIFRESNTTQITIAPGGFVGIGNPNPTDRLNVNGNVSLLLAVGGTTQVCQNGSFQIATCGSSSRYKQNVNPFASGLSLINRLRPVSFNWKANNIEDLGLIAEEVAEVEPLLVTHNDKGDIEGVKYDRVAVVLINAVKEQQAQIADQKQQNDALQKQVNEQSKIIKGQQAELEALKSFICSQDPKAEFCQPKN